MRDITKELVELVRLISTDLPCEIKGSLKKAIN